MDRSLIIVVNLLSGDKPGQLLESVRAQSDLRFELLITLPTDDVGLAERVAEWVERHRLSLPSTCILRLKAENLVEARNIALREIEQEYVMFAYGDMRLDKDFVFEIRRELGKEAVEMIVLETALRDSDGWTERELTADSNLLRAHILDDAVSVPRIVVATKLLHAIGGWDESNPDVADFILGCRLLTLAQGVGNLRNIPYVIFGDKTCRRPLPEFDQIEYSMNETNAILRGGCEGETCPRWLAARRMILSGELTRRKKREQAERLSDEALSSVATVAERIKLGLIRDTQAYFGRGGRQLSRMLL